MHFYILYSTYTRSFIFNTYVVISRPVTSTYPPAALMAKCSVVSSVADVVRVASDLAERLGVEVVLHNGKPLSSVLDNESSRERLEGSLLEAAAPAPATEPGRLGRMGGAIGGAVGGAVGGLGGLWRRRPSGGTGPSADAPEADVPKPPPSDAETEMVSGIARPPAAAPSVARMAGASSRQQDLAEASASTDEAGNLSLVDCI